MDPSWEFQAPQFVDFNNIGNEEDNADEFFGVDENGVRLSSGFGTVSFVFEEWIKVIINDLIDVIFVCKGFEVIMNVLKEVISESTDKNVSNAKMI